MGASVSRYDGAVKRAPIAAAVAAVSCVASSPFATSGFSQTSSDSTYLVYVASEAADKISLVRFGPDGGRIDREIAIGVMPVDIAGWLRGRVSL